MTTTPTPLEDTYFHGRVLRIVTDEERPLGESTTPYQKVEVLFRDGGASGTIATVENGGAYTILKEQKVAVGDEVVIVRTNSFSEQKWYLADRYRVPTFFLLCGIFVAAVLLFGGWRGLTALVGLGSTIAVLLLYIVPQIIAGTSPLLVSIIGTTLIAVLSMYVAHGINRRTTVALLSTLLSLGLSIVVTIFFVNQSHLLGTAAEEVFYLHLPNGGTLDFRGVLLAGIIIGVLGVLDDVTTAQTASIDELLEANPTLSFRALYKHGASIGKEHIASLVNTLVLAYAGTALPLLLILSTQQGKPLWTIVNAEALAEEIVRTLAGSVTLVFAVPLSTAIAAWIIPKWKKS
jgi:uncharacterized membrane protein